MGNGGENVKKEAQVALWVRLKQGNIWENVGDLAANTDWPKWQGVSGGHGTRTPGGEWGLLLVGVCGCS